MFWKKKKASETPVIAEPSNSREAFRYTFKRPDAPVIVFKGRQLPLINISASGLAFENYQFSESDTDTVELNLEIPNFNGDPGIRPRVRILTIDKQGVCHCIFENNSPEQEEIIHKYLLEMQKKDLRAGKKS